MIGFPISLIYILILSKKRLLPISCISWGLGYSVWIVTMIDPSPLFHPRTEGADHCHNRSYKLRLLRCIYIGTRLFLEPKLIGCFPGRYVQGQISSPQFHE